MSSRTPFKVFLSFHSYFELIIFPWGHKKDACPDYLNLLEGGAVMARVRKLKILNKLLLYQYFSKRNICVAIFKYTYILMRCTIFFFK